MVSAVMARARWGMSETTIIARSTVSKRTVRIQLLLVHAMYTTAVKATGKVSVFRLYDEFGVCVCMRCNFQRGSPNLFAAVDFSEPDFVRFSNMLQTEWHVSGSRCFEVGCWCIEFGRCGCMPCISKLVMFHFDFGQFNFRNPPQCNFLRHKNDTNSCGLVSHVRSQFNLFQF